MRANETPQDTVERALAAARPGGETVVIADEVSSAITTQSSHRAAASARSTVSCGLLPSRFPAGAVMFLPPRC